MRWLTTNGILDELIRQVAVSCAERGLLLMRVRDELRLTISTYQSLLESAVAYGLRKALLVEQQQSQAAVERDQERQRNIDLIAKVSQYCDFRIDPLPSAPLTASSVVVHNRIPPLSPSGRAHLFVSPSKRPRCQPPPLTRLPLRSATMRKASPFFEVEHLELNLAEERRVNEEELALLEERMTEDNQRLRDANNTLKVSALALSGSIATTSLLYQCVLVSTASVTPVGPGGQSGRARRKEDR